MSLRYGVSLRYDVPPLYPVFALQELDLVEEEDQFTHMLTLEDAVSSEDLLNVFSFDPSYEQNEEKYKVLKKEILDEDSGDESDDGSGTWGVT